MLTPLDIHKKEFRRGFRGYNEQEVDMFLDQLAKDYEEVYSANLDLKEQIEKYKNGIVRYKELEDVIKETLIMAQKNAEELKSNTEKEVQVMLQESKLEAERKSSEADRKSEQILQAAEKKASQMINEAEVRVKEAMKEYEDLSNQIKFFKIRFRSFLELQLQMLEEEPLKNSELPAEENSTVELEYTLEFNKLRIDNAAQEEQQVI
ncbi:DivIVA family protein [Desulfofarcimen acetoxidans DSM 771]|uniref:DivIVA family protein n=1 Tax=Desulfofarcimen acetoxidans (strain ATCC 49208 / DSM 771 / KCTC 5769 / VKM B-1644 / 5575) TaxID=485916 RepID=C8W4A5_DESAS|nr:DivIVA domain-containing protein [Desulfofarcimen acetoxidans]ACV61973.1 DivIVA family protein [Desulfofarcimen acetoxidans DSM 771]